MPEDNIISTEDIKKGYALFATSGMEGGERAIKPLVLHLKDENLEETNGYIGSYIREGYVVDAFRDENGNMYLEQNIYSNMFNSQDWYPVIGNYLGTPRIDIETGKNEKLQEYDKSCIEEENEYKEQRRQFFYNTIKEASETFGISKKQAKEIISYIGTVSALKGATDFAKVGLSKKELNAIQRKISYNGVYGISKKVQQATEGMKLFTIQNSADGLLFIDEILGGSDRRKEIVSKLEEAREKNKSLKEKELKVDELREEVKKQLENIKNKDEVKDEK